MDYIKLGKEISYALRHAPFKYGLELDDEGWVNLEDLLSALNKEKKWGNVTVEDIEHIMEISDKKRYEIKDDRIRALYGHSISKKIVKTVAEPPEILFHGTARRFLDSIMDEGLLCQGRQYVHLSVDKETAFEVGKRHDDKPVILEVYAKKAFEEGIKFYLGNDKVWLSENIPSKYIK